MNTTRPKSITWIAVLLVILALTSAVTPFLNLGRGAFVGNPNNPGGGNFQPGPGGGNFQPGQLPPGDGTFQPGQGGGNGGSGGGNFQGRGGGRGLFGLFGAARTLGINVQIISYISTSFTILGIFLTLLAAYGVWKQKRWGLNLAMVLSLLIVLGALPTLFLGGGRFFGGFNVLAVVRSVLNYVKPLTALPVLVLSILPSTRDFTN